MSRATTDKISCPWGTMQTHEDFLPVPLLRVFFFLSLSWFFHFCVSAGSAWYAHCPMYARMYPRIHLPTDRYVHVLNLMRPRTDVFMYSVWCAHRPMCSRTQPDVPTDQCVHVHNQMCPRTDVSTDRCVHVLSLTSPRTDVPTYSARCVYRPLCPSTQPGVPTDPSVHRPIRPRTHLYVPADQYVGPDMILSGWMGSKHQRTNYTYRCAHEPIIVRVRLGLVSSRLGLVRIRLWLWLVRIRLWSGSGIVRGP